MTTNARAAVEERRFSAALSDQLDQGFSPGHPTSPAFARTGDFDSELRSSETQNAVAPPLSRLFATGWDSECFPNAEYFVFLVS
jgi:hypothetical protein